MTVAALKKLLNTMPDTAQVILAVEVPQKGKKKDDDDSFTKEAAAANVALRPDNRVQIGDRDN
jgi:hypothetical protein